MNFAGCKECGKKEPLKTLGMFTEEDVDGEELVTYKRMYCHDTVLNIRVTIE